MCGFVAIFAYRGTAPPVDQQELRLIRDHMAARGPDGVGEWLSEDRRVGLGSRRLAIIDPTSRGDQPMTSSDRRLVIAFNGEIYNHAELRGELTAQGRTFVSHSDTEVLLQLYGQRGEAMLEALRGMFAFAIWDGRERTLFLARDPYGIKPLYYADNGNTLRVASQVKALLAGGHVSRTIDPAGAAGFFLTGSVPEPVTIRDQVRALPAGSSLLIREGERPVEPKQFFSIAKTYGEAAEKSEPPEVFAAALLESVRYHLVSDVPVGAFLSAGMDSCSIVGLARDAGATDLQTLTLAFEEYRGTSDDEVPLAESAAALYRTKHTTRVVKRAEFDRDRDSVLDTMDQPTIDGVNTWFVSKAAHEQGLKVALSGLGGDELFGSYPSFSEIPLLVRSVGPVSRLPFIPRAIRLGWSKLARAGRGQKLAGVLEFGGTYAGAYFLRRALFMPWELRNLLGRDMAEEGLRRLNLIPMIESHLAPDPRKPYGRIATLESSLYMRNQLLRDTDWASMAHSVEVRVPLVDAFLLQRLAPLLLRMNGNAKQKLALSPSTPLPVEIRNKPKTGFSVPIGRWLAPAARRRHTSPMRLWARHVYDATTWG